MQLHVPNSLDTGVIIESLKMQLRLLFFMKILITMCWSIWTMRNDIIFRNVPHSVQRCRQVFRKEFALIILMAKMKFHPQIDLWQEAFV
jgi:hypothetical protein